MFVIVYYYHGGNLWWSEYLPVVDQSYYDIAKIYWPIDFLFTNQYLEVVDQSYIFLFTNQYLYQREGRESKRKVRNHNLFHFPPFHICSSVRQYGFHLIYVSTELLFTVVYLLPHFLGLKLNYPVAYGFSFLLSVLHFPCS